MPRIVSFLIFFTLASTILFGMNFFVYTKISTTFSISSKYISWIKYGLILINLSLILGIFLSRLFDFYLIQNFAFYWLGFLFPTFCFIFVMNLIGKIIPGHRPALILIAVGLSLVSFFYSIYNGSKLPRTKTLTISHSNIQPEDSGFSIVHLSDLHLNNNQKNCDYIQFVVKRVNEINPDIVVITGDLFDEPIKEHNGMINVLSQLRAKRRIFAVSGNHEHYNGMDNFVKNLSQTPIKILKNEKKHLVNNIFICGIDDPEVHSLQKYLESEQNLFNHLNDKDFNILLYHRPGQFGYFSKKGIDLQLSGHTHAGQIFPFDFFVNLIYKYPFGLYKKGESYIYTSCGTGIWGPKMRTFSRSEIVHIVLKSENKSG